MIHTLHGVVKNWDNDLQSHKLYVDKEKFERYLNKKKTKYLSWNPKEYEQDVLTIDDSTKAGAEACLLAKRLGHEVTFFVNPWQIITGELYFINILDLAIDNRKNQLIQFNGLNFDLTNKSIRRQFRNSVKEIFKTKSHIDAIQSTIEISKLLNSDLDSIPDSFNPISTSELINLFNNGIQIENHGWSHIEIASFTEQELLKDIQDSKEWIKQTLGYSSSLYAVPFGLTELPSKIQNSNSDNYFLVNSTRDLGAIGKSSWNRLDITYYINSENYDFTFCY